MNGENHILLQELCLLINILICFGIPINSMIILNKKSGKLIKPFIIGMLAFLISQPLLRIPLLQFVLPNFEWYQLMQFNPYVYGIFLGLTAGIFEETARFFFMKFVLKNRTRMEDGLAFGLGHGGIEAILLTGIGSLSTLFLNPLEQVDLSTTSNLSILTGGIERMFAMTFHVGASLIVLYGIRRHKAFRYTTLAILLHGLLDSMLVILPAAFGIGTLGLEIYVMIVSLLVFIFAIRLFIKVGHSDQRKTSCNLNDSGI